MSNPPDLTAIRATLGGQPYVVVADQAPTAHAPAGTHFVGAVLIPEAYVDHVAEAFATTLPDGAGTLARALRQSGYANAAVLGRALEAGKADEGFALSVVYTEVSYRSSGGDAETLQLGTVPNRFFETVKGTGRPAVSERELAGAFVKYTANSLAIAINDEGLELD